MYRDCFKQKKAALSMNAGLFAAKNIASIASGKLETGGLSLRSVIRSILNFWKSLQTLSWVDHVRTTPHGSFQLFKK